MYLYCKLKKHILRGKTMCPWEIELPFWNESSFRIIMVIIPLHSMCEYICIEWHLILNIQKIWGKAANVVCVMNKKVYPVMALGLLNVQSPSICLLLCIYTLHPRIEKLSCANVLLPWWLCVNCVRKKR